MARTRPIDRLLALARALRATPARPARHRARVHAVQAPKALLLAFRPMGTQD